MTEKEVENYYKFWSEIGEVIEDSNYFNVFLNSKTLITDSGSFLSEFFPTKKPLIHLKSNNNPISYNNYVESILKTQYSIRTKEELENILIEIILNNKDFKLQERVELFDKHSIKNSASKNIINHLKKQLKLPQIDSL